MCQVLLRRPAYRKATASGTTDAGPSTSTRPYVTSTAPSPAPYGRPRPLAWVSPPRNILLVKKPRDRRTLAGARTVIQHIRSAYPEASIIVEDSVAAELHPDFPFLYSFAKDEKENLARTVDLVLALGGDGTVLHTSSLFDSGPVPPVLGLTLGTLGFLLPFHLDAFEATLADVMESRAQFIMRMRLHCSVRSADGTTTDRFGIHGMNAMNEVSLHRGSSPHMTSIDAFVDSQHLTEAVADGLVVATPTGSTAYSLSAGGPIVHPSVQSMLLTPICPRSLSFRTVLLPSDVCIQLKVDEASRSPAELSLDGREVRLLHPGEHLNVSMSRHGLPCITAPHTPTLDGRPPLRKDCGRGEGDSWVKDINEMLSFNTTFKAKGARHAAMVEEE